MTSYAKARGLVETAPMQAVWIVSYFEKDQRRILVFGREEPAMKLFESRLADGPAARESRLSIGMWPVLMGLPADGDL